MLTARHLRRAPFDYTDGHSFAYVHVGCIDAAHNPYYNALPGPIRPDKSISASSSVVRFTYFGLEEGEEGCFIFGRLKTIQRQ